jgi:hypothetical protein
VIPATYGAINIPFLKLRERVGDAASFIPYFCHILNASWLMNVGQPSCSPGRAADHSPFCFWPPAYLPIPPHSHSNCHSLQPGVDPFLSHLNRLCTPSCAGAQPPNMQFSLRAAKQSSRTRPLHSMPIQTSCPHGLFVFNRAAFFSSKLAPIHGCCGWILGSWLSCRSTSHSNKRTCCIPSQ